MDDLSVKKRITAAMKEPSPPERLIQNTVRLIGAISAGRSAERQLETEAGNVSRAEEVQLAATGLIGRLAAAKALPGEASPEELAGRLASEPRFIQAVEAGNVLGRLKSGELLRDTVKEAPEKEPEQPEQPKPERNGPAL